MIAPSIQALHNRSVNPTVYPTSVRDSINREQFDTCHWRYLMLTPSHRRRMLLPSASVGLRSPPNDLAEEAASGPVRRVRHL